MKLMTIVIASLIAVGLVLTTGCVSESQVNTTNNPGIVETPSSPSTPPTPVPAVTAVENDTISEADYCLQSGNFNSERCISLRNKLERRSDDSRAIIECMRDGREYSECARGTSLDPTV